MPARLTHALVLGTTAILFFGLPTGAQEIPKSAPAPVSLYDTQTLSLASSFIDQEYRLFVALPRGYDQSTDRYPVLYVLDADIFFGTITETARLLPLESFFAGHQTVPDLIIVGIAYPGGLAEMTQRRGRDFTPTVEVDADPGTATDGAAQFSRFLQQQAVPLIDMTFRTRATDRTLLGSSAGGLFVLDTLLRHPGTFHRYIATSPRVDEIIFRYESAYSERNQEMKAILYLSAGTEGEIEKQLAAGVDKLYAALKARGYSKWRIVHESLEGENHVSAQPTAFTHGLKAAFAQPTDSP